MMSHNTGRMIPPELREHGTKLMIERPDFLAFVTPACDPGRFGEHP